MKSTASKISSEQEKSDLVLSVVKKFRVVFKSAQQHSRWVESQCGASAAQIWALIELSRHPGWRVSELAAAMALHQSTVSNLLEKLEKKRLIRRQRDSEDLRAQRVHLTAAGKKLLLAAPTPAMSLLPNTLHRLPASVLADLDRSVGRLVAQLTTRDDDAALQPLTWI